MSSPNGKWIPKGDYIEGIEQLSAFFNGNHFFVTCKPNAEGEPKVSTFVTEDLISAKAGDGKSLSECINWMQSPHELGTRSIGIVPHKNDPPLIVVDIDNGVKNYEDLDRAVGEINKQLGSSPVCVIPTLKAGRGHAYYLSESPSKNVRWQLGEFSGEIRSNSGYVVIYDAAYLADALFRYADECTPVRIERILKKPRKLSENTREDPRRLSVKSRGHKLSTEDQQHNKSRVSLDENPEYTMLDGTAYADLAKEDPDKLIALTLNTPESGETPGLDYDIGDPELGRNNAVFRCASYIARAHGFSGERYIEKLVQGCISKWGHSRDEWVKSAESGYNRGASYYSDQQVDDKIFQKQVSEFLRKAKALPRYTGNAAPENATPSSAGHKKAEISKPNREKEVQRSTPTDAGEQNEYSAPQTESEDSFSFDTPQFAVDEEGQLLFYDIRHDQIFPSALDVIGVEHRFNCRLDKVEFKKSLKKPELKQHLDAIRPLWGSSDQMIRQLGFTLQGCVRIVKKAAKNKEVLVQLQPRIDSLQRCHSIACATGHRYDPVLDYFRSCTERDDAVDYSQIFQSILGAEDTEVTRWASRHLVLSIVSRSLEFDRTGGTLHARQSIMLIDPDGGSGKGVLLRTIIPRHLRSDFYAQNLDLSEAPGTIAEIVGGRMIVEWTEGKGWLTTQKRRSRVTDEDVKAFMDRQDDGPRRKAYGRVPENFPRLATIVVTTNNTSPMPDDKALRDRFVQIHVDPVELKDQVSNYHRIKNIIERNRQHWWAQAFREAKSKGSNIELGLPDELREEVFQDNIQSRTIRNEDNELKSIIMLSGWENKTTDQIANDIKLRLEHTSMAQLKSIFDTHAKIRYAIKRIVPGLGGKSRRIRYGPRDKRRSEYRWIP